MSDLTARLWIGHRKPIALPLWYWPVAVGLMLGFGPGSWPRMWGGILVGLAVMGTIEWFRWICDLLVERRERHARGLISWERGIATVTCGCGWCAMLDVQSDGDLVHMAENLARVGYEAHRQHAEGAR